MKTLLKMLLALALFLPGFALSVTDGDVGVAEAEAADAKVRVDVIKATKEGSGPDKRSARFKSVLDQATMYKGFSYVDGGDLSAPLGKSATLKLGDRTVTASLKSLDAGKSKTEIVIKSKSGESHKTTISLRNGASHVWAIKRGDAADLVIVRVSY